MTRDYRRGSPPPPPPIPKPPRRQRSCVWWFLLGFLIGGLGVWAVLKFNPVAIWQIRVAPPAVERPVSAPPSFEFAEILRDTEVEIGGEDAAAAPRPPPPGTATVSAPAASGGAFLVQAGAFRSAADADRLKAQLALLGVQTKVHTSTAPGGETWHRVRAGPYPDRKTAEQVQSLLKRNNQDSVVLNP